MGYYSKTELSTNEKLVNIYTGISKEELDTNIDNLLCNGGYKIKEGKRGMGTYEKGSRVMRILFGAFVKYFQFNITTESIATDSVKLIVTRTSTGMSGGLIGINQVRNELKRLAAELQTL